MLKLPLLGYFEGFKGFYYVILTFILLAIRVTLKNTIRHLTGEQHED